MQFNILFKSNLITKVVNGKKEQLGRTTQYNPGSALLIYQYLITWYKARKIFRSYFEAIFKLKPDFAFFLANLFAMGLKASDVQSILLNSRHRQLFIIQWIMIASRPNKSTKNAFLFRILLKALKSFSNDVECIPHKLILITSIGIVLISGSGCSTHYI